MLSFICLTICLAQTPLATMPESELNAYLSGLQKNTLTLDDRISEIARKSLGISYADSPLGEGPGAKYDPDPLMDLSQVDCVTFVEQTLSLAASSTYQAAFDRLQRIRYQNGKVDYLYRNHFFISDWIAHNTFCQDVTGEMGVKTGSVTRAISRKDFFVKTKAPELGQEIPDQVQTLAYIPIDKAEEAATHITRPTLVVFAGKIDWLFALHCGFLIPDASGKVMLYHASSKAKAVATIPFAQYASEQSSRYLGFTLYQITEKSLVNW